MKFRSSFTLFMSHAYQQTFFLRLYLFIFRERGRREVKRERNINVWLPLMCLLLGTWPATQACALTGNWTRDPLVCWQALSPLSHSSQGPIDLIWLSCMRLFFAEFELYYSLSALIPQPISFFTIHSSPIFHNHQCWTVGWFSYQNVSYNVISLD